MNCSTKPSKPSDMNDVNVDCVRKRVVFSGVLTITTTAWFRWHNAVHLSFRSVPLASTGTGNSLGCLAFVRDQLAELCELKQRCSFKPTGTRSSGVPSQSIIQSLPNTCAVPKGVHLTYCRNRSERDLCTSTIIVHGLHLLRTPTVHFSRYPVGVHQHQAHWQSFSFVPF